MVLFLSIFVFVVRPRQIHLLKLKLFSMLKRFLLLAVPAMLLFSTMAAMDIVDSSGMDVPPVSL